jgi:hypothetical protein
MSSTVTLAFIEIPETTYLVGLIVVTLIISFFLIWSTIKKLRNPYPKLTNFVKLSVKNGENKLDIREKLTDAGWPENLVDYELDKYH